MFKPGDWVEHQGQDHKGSLLATLSVWKDQVVEAHVAFLGLNATNVGQ